jgi:hypothetical protein
MAISTINFVKAESYVVLKADFHVHTTYSDGHYTPTQVVDIYKNYGYDVIAITDHNYVAGWSEAITEGHVKNIIVIKGEELSYTWNGTPSSFKHLNGLFLTSHIYNSAWNNNELIKPIADAVHAQGGLIVVNHPQTKWGDPNGRYEWNKFIASGNTSYIDGWEYSADSWGTSYDTWALSTGKPVLFDHDFHYNNSTLSTQYTLLLAHNRTEAGVKDALLNGRSVAFINGTYFGTPQNIALAQSSPPWTLKTFDLSILTPVGSGTTSPISGTNAFDEGSKVQVEAHPSVGWVFDHWISDGLEAGDSKLFNITMDATHTLQAVFTKIPISQVVRFAVIGDYGNATSPEGDVASLVASWHPDFIITTGDNNYLGSGAWDLTIGQYYHNYIYPYNGGYGSGAAINMFFPSLGNHDWNVGLSGYIDYFTLPGNERYYNFTWGPVHLYALDSDVSEPDGRTNSSTQAMWLETLLSTSKEPWNIIYFHEPPYSSGTTHGSTTAMRWPYKDWGATAVITGHEHNYERLMEGGLPYFVNGAGGKNRYPLVTSISGSQVMYSSSYGAMLVEADANSIKFSFYTREGNLVDEYEIMKSPTASHDLTIQAANEPGDIYPIPGIHTYYQGSTVSVDAQPKAGYQLDHWELDGSNVGSTNPYTVTINANHQLKAIFKASNGGSPNEGTLGYSPEIIAVAVISVIVVLALLKKVKKR